MPSHTDDDWSDSDSDVGSEVETSVLLGIPDGPIQAPSELCDAAVSRIGGHPVRVVLHMHFFLRENRLFLPLNAKYALFLWSCWCKCGVPLKIAPWTGRCTFGVVPEPGANVKREDPPSVRAWRGLRYNEKYAAKLERKLAKRREQAEADIRAKEQAEKARQAPKASNPFSLNSSLASANPFGLGAQIFGDETPSTPAETGSEVDDGKQEHSDDEDEDSKSTSSEQSLLTAMASTTLDESPWKSAPAYPPLYLSTISEYLPSQPKPKVPSGVHVNDPADEEGGKDVSWAFEPYENSLEVDHAFERFTKRVGYEGEQCVRYELKGIPLPFSSDKVFETLFPTPPAPPLPITKPDFKVVHAPKRIYSPTSAALPPCPYCKRKRIFECQLMPNLINVLRTVDDTEKQLTDEQRRDAVRQALRGEVGKGMEWGTCMVFSCEDDCRVGEDGKEVKDVWREEIVLVQWDI